MARSIPRPDPSEYDPYYQGYLDQLPDDDVLELLATQIEDAVATLQGLTPTQAGYRYAPGKWSTREVVGHLIDVERVLTYRALRASRGDATEIPGFEQDDYVASGNYDERSLGDLLQEFQHVRAATVDLFRGMPDVALGRQVKANGVRVSVRALACIVAGHERHHLRIFREKYLPRMPGR